MISQILTAAELDRIRAARPASSEPITTNAHSPLLSLLANTDRKKLAQLIVEQQYVPGQIIILEGDTGDAMYIIRSGRVAVVKGDFGTPTVLGYRGVGEIVGEMALLENRPRFASIIALDKVSLLRIRREDFLRFLRTNTDLGMSILRALSTRLRAADEARSDSAQTEQRLTQLVSELETEKQRLLELQRLRQETSDLIVHDLRNPLSLISGAINMLELTLPDNILADNRELVDLININCGRMKRLVDALLDVTQMESGNFELVLTPIDLVYLIKKACERTTPILKSYEITLASTVPEELPPVVVDEEKIDRVLANLMDNALKFTPQGGQVTIGANWDDHQVTVHVANSGPTIPAEDRERIFERFTHASINRQNRGFGLGLTFCRLAVEAHHGRMWVEPVDEGEGNRFVFTLPLSAEPAIT
ncbi:MAG: ATP-binding protein [Chloroflexota bacterium]